MLILEPGQPFPARYMHRRGVMLGDEEPEAAHQGWLRAVFDKAGLADKDVCVQRGAERHEWPHGKVPERNYTVGFTEFIDCAVFQIAVYGDAPIERHFFVEKEFETEINPYWLKAAKGFLAAAEIPFECKTYRNMVTITLDRFSHLAALRLAEESIADLAKRIQQADFLAGKIKPLADTLSPHL